MNMAPVNRDIIIPKEILEVFRKSVRIIDKKHLAGMWPVDFHQLGRLQKTMPELFGNQAITSKFNVAINYKGKTMKKDLEKYGIQFIEERFIHDTWIQGLPVPWQWIKKAGLDSEKFDILLSPKQ